MTLRQVSKAMAAGVAALAGAYGTAFADGQITRNEWIGIAGTSLLAILVTYFAPKNAEPARDVTH